MSKHHSSKRAKHKSNQSVSIANQGIFSAKGGEVVGSSSTSSQLHLGSSSSQSSLHNRRSGIASSSSSNSLHDQQSLEDIDQDNVNLSPSKSIRSLSKKQRQLMQQQLFQRQNEERKAAARRSPWVLWSRDEDGPDLWSWLTSSRTISPLQRQQEEQEEEVLQTLHEKRLLRQLGEVVEGTKDKAGVDEGQEEVDTTELEKKLAKHSWDTAKMVQAFDLTGRDWAAMTVLTVTTLGVRFWRVSWPDEVVLDESHMGQVVNGYLKNEFAFDVHPPLGKLLLSGIGALSQYNGAFAFDDIGDSYPGTVPYVAMRAIMALLGVLCVPMAYVTLKATGQGASAAILAATLVAFDTALTAKHRLMALDAPLLFFTAATAMSWNLYMKQAPRPFGMGWWMWLTMTGVAMTGAVSTKLDGILSVAIVGMSALSNLWSLARAESVSSLQWVKHLAAHLGLLLALPAVIYMAIFQLHFSLQDRQPDYKNSLQAEADLSLLSHPFRHSLAPRYPEDSDEIWSDVVYGSVIQLQNEHSTPTYLHSFYKANPGGTKQQQVGGYEYPDQNTHWIVIRAELDEDEPEEIPSRLQFLKNGDLLRLRHVPTRRCLHSHDHRVYTDPANKNMHEVTAYGGPGWDGDANDWWIVEVLDQEARNPLPKDKREPVKALSTAFRLKHATLGCYLFASDSVLPEPWGERRKELICRGDTRVTPKSIWRVTMNDHDYLPMDTPVAKYPQMPFWRKFVETHRVMWTYKNPLEATYQPSTAKPWRWPLAQSFIPAWAGYKRQVAVVANPVVWGTAAAGLLAFVAATVVFTVREKRGFFEKGLVGELKRYYLHDASTYFTGWVAHFAPFFLVPRALTMDHYFPALYYSILMTASLLSGLTAFLPRRIRFGLYLGLIVLSMMVFVQFSPLAYGSLMSKEHCERLGLFVNSLPDHRAHRLDCTHAPKAGTRVDAASSLKQQARKEKELLSLQKKMAAQETARQANPSPASEQEDSSAQNPNWPYAPPAIVVDNNYITRAAARVADGPHATSVAGPPKVPRPLHRQKAPVLPMHFPPIDVDLPMQHLFMTPYQRPPQLWDVDQKVQPNAYQQQQQQQQQQEQPAANAVSPQQGDNVQVDNEQQLEEMLKQYRARGQAIKAERGPADQKPKVLQKRNPDQDDPLQAHTQGLAFPPNHAGRPNYDLREKMMANAEAFAKKQKEIRRASGALFPSREQFEEEDIKSRSKSIEASRIAAGLGPIPVRGTAAVVAQQDAADSARAAFFKKIIDNAKLDQLEEELKSKEEKEKKKKALEDGIPYEAPKPKAMENASRPKRLALKDRIPPPVETESEEDEGDEEAEETYEEYDEEEEEGEVEVRGPPISVNSPEELEKVLEQLNAEGVRAEVVRGDVTETIEPEATPVAELEEEDGESYEDYEGGDDEEGQEAPPPIAVNNAEELASVLDRLAKEGVRAEVVRGTATRYVQPPETVQ